MHPPTGIMVDGRWYWVLAKLFGYTAEAIDAGELRIEGATSCNRGLYTRIYPAMRIAETRARLCLVLGTLSHQAQYALVECSGRAEGTVHTASSVPGATTTMVTGAWNGQERGQIIIPNQASYPVWIVYNRSVLPSILSHFSGVLLVTYCQAY